MVNSTSLFHKEVITEKEFISIFKEACIPFFKLINYAKTQNGVFASKRFYSNLLNVSDSLEGFLDDHGARENRGWIYITELVASIRNFSISAYHLKHIIERLKSYQIEDTYEEMDSFIEDAKEAIIFFDTTLTLLFEKWESEVLSKGISLTNYASSADEIKDIYITKTLPRTAEEETVLNKEEHIIELVRRFKKVSKLFKEENFGKRYLPEKLFEVVPTKLDEKKVQKLKNIIHGVQSDYDTYVKNTDIEAKDMVLRQFRGYVSISLHLLIIVILLLHFYERHENDIRQGAVREKISSLINKTDVLDKAINFSFYYANIFLQIGGELADRLQSAYIKPIRYELPVPKPIGFHARPATYISMVVNEHGSDVFMIIDGRRFNAKSVLSLMEAGGIVSERKISKVTFEGDKRALDDIKILAEHNYCEDGVIPTELNYIRILRNIR